MSVSIQLLRPLLRCPDCGSPFRGDGEAARLDCSACGSHFPWTGRGPDLMPTRIRGQAGWETWEDHLRGFAERRRKRSEAPNPKQLRRWMQKQEAFARFLSLDAGPVLDVGCGPGEVRHSLDGGRHPYVGLDPLPDPGVEAFAFVRGVAEALPFASGQFAAVFARSALDHFCDLPAFFREAHRVLRPGGRLVLEQAVHESEGLWGKIRVLAHRAKDALDETAGAASSAAPKHMHEFTRRRLEAVVPSALFRPIAQEAHAPGMFAALQWLLSYERIAE
jgi:SAM-dependent methyltransferase